MYFNPIAPNIIKWTLKTSEVDLELTPVYVPQWNLFAEVKILVLFYGYNSWTDRRSLVQ
jgi:hypothetical protein